MKHHSNTIAEYRSAAPRLLLEDLLSSSIVLLEDFEHLPEHVQGELSECSANQELLRLLVAHGLLTEYQAARIEAGKTEGLILELSAGDCG